MIANDISVRPAKYQVCMQGSLVIEYQPSKGPSSQSHAVRGAQCYVMRSSSPTTILWPGEFIEVDVPPDLEQDSIIAIEPRIDTCAWPQPQIVEAVGHKVRIENTSDEPQKIRRHEHICQARPTKDPTTSSMPSPSPTQDLPAKPKPSPPLLRWCEAWPW